jgi:transcriptional regulator
MYEPQHFRIEDRAELLAIIRAHPLGLLISAGADGLQANPVPFTLARDEAGNDLLRAHLARPNPQWRALIAAPDVLVAFQASGHYVTPSWYATKRETGKVVPTWHYVHVQVRGRASIHEDTGFLAAQIAALTAEHEAKRALPWSVGDAPEPYIKAQMRGIIGIEIAIEAITGKFKLSQNRPEADLAGVIAGLAAEPDAEGPAMAAFIRDRRARHKPDRPGS